MTAATAAMEKMNYISNNLSNMNTVGFRARQVSFSNVLSKAGLLGDSYVELSEPDLSKRDGGIINDNVDTHLALRGEAFFALEAEDGETLLTRSGNFQLNENGELVSSLGEIVLGQNGPITFLPDQKDFTVTADGRVIDDLGAELDQLLILNGDELTPLEGQRYRAGKSSPAEGGFEIIQGALEGSNVDPFQTMLDLIQTSRAFEGLQKFMSNSKEIDSSMINSVKRSR
jgi:flagellar basal-body rod protein FlgF